MRTLIFSYVILSLCLFCSTVFAEESKSIESIDTRNSSFISSGSFDLATNRLTIRFRQANGAASKNYHYLNFPKSRWLAWQAAESKGKYYNQFIKGRRWEKYQQLSNR